MNYLVARASGPNNRDVAFQQLGCATGSQVRPERTQFTGLFDAEGNPIHRRTESKPRLGFHCAR